MSLQQHQPNVEEVQVHDLFLSVEEVQGAMTSEAETMIGVKFSAFCSRGYLVNAWMAVSFSAKMKLHQVSFTSPWTIMFLACLILSALTDIEMNMKFVTEHFQFQRPWILAYLSTILQISAATALMLFFNTRDTMAVFLLFGLVFFLLIYLFIRMFGRGIVPWRKWLEFEEELSRGFEMSALAVAPSVAGLSGKVLGYSNLTGGGGHTTAVAPESFLFYSAVAGLLVLLFCTVPPALIYRSYRMNMARVFIPGMAYIAVSFLVVATIVAAEKILHEYVYLVCCPIIILGVLLYLYDAEGSSFCLPRERPPQQSLLSEERETEATLSKYLSTPVSTILIAIMAIHSSYGIGSGGSTVSLSWPWKAFVCLAVCSILSHTVRIFILDKMTETRRYEISRTIWKAWTMVSVASTAVFAVLLIYLHPDEVKNIF